MNPNTSSLAPNRSSPTAPVRAGGASLDVLRFLGAGFILLFHFGGSAPVDLASLLPVFKQGWLATDFFLLLSGYILSRAYGHRLTLSGMRRTHFFLRRFSRLWPSHFLVLLIFGVFVLGSAAAGFTPQHSEKYNLLDFFLQAFLVHGWGLVKGPSWNVPTWTISALLVCYALFSLYVPLIYKRARLVLLGGCLAVIATAHLFSLTWAHHAFVDLPFAWGLLRAVPLFLIGNMIERLTIDLRVTQRTFWLLLPALLVALIFLILLPREAVTDSLILAVLSGVLALAGAVSFSESSLTRRMGRASWSLFLTHSLVGAVWFGITPKLVTYLGLGQASQWGLWGLGVVIALATAFLFDSLVDTPLSKRVQSLSFVKGEA